MAAPKGTPSAIVTRLNGEISQFLKQPDVAEKFSAVGLFVFPNPPERIPELVRTATDRMGKLVRGAGIHPE